MSTQHLWLPLCAVLTLTVGLHFVQNASAQHEHETARLTGEFWKADVSKWGDGRDFEKPSPQHLPHGFDLDWQIHVPTTGWYELYLRGGAQMNHDVFVDGQCQWRYAKPGKDEKAGNIYLTAGKHTLKIRRVGRMSFPKIIFDRFELVETHGQPNASIAANKTDVDVMRVGEQFEIKITAGGTHKAVTYDLFRTDLRQPKVPAVKVAQVTFDPTSKPSTKTVLIDCPFEGAFSLSAAVGQTQLSDAEFKIGQFAVVDVNHIQPVSAKKELVVEVDCVNQTINGQAIVDDEFVEANGPTRVTNTAFGAYRESHDCTPPQAVTPKTAVQMPNGYSGFSYRIKLPKTQVPYLMEVDIPDDARRSVPVLMTWVDDKTGGFLKPASGYKGKSYETGGRYGLTHQMQTHSAIAWGDSHSLLVSVLSQEPGTRAAAAKIRIYRFADDQLPAVKLQSAGKRDFYHWFEEAHNWRFLVGIAGIRDEQIVKDMIGLDRWVRFVQYHGGNGIQALGVAYQGAFWRTQLLDGFMPEPYDRCRLLALFCEKYGMKYMLEIFGNQNYFTNIKIPSLAENPLDVKPTSLNGVLMAAGAHSDINALHTGVQDFYVDVAKELHRKLGDSPAFAGLTVRADVWKFHGDFTLPSIYWGYNDWTIRQFENDTGIKVPAEIKDPDRFARRFEFLTASGMRARWINWRCDRLLTYHKRFRDALAGDRDDIVFGFSGDFRTDSIYDLPKDIKTRALEAGVDLDARKNEPGLVVMPGGRYGSRSIAMRYHKAYDGFISRENVEAGKGAIRGFASYMNYLEQSTEWPARLLGVKMKDKEKPPYFCSAALAAGRHSLEKYAVVLAEQDTTFFRDGGNTDMFGSPQYYKPWFDTYRTIPAIAFEQVDTSLDQIAIWHGTVDKQKATDTLKAGLYFYAVNRSADEVSVVLDIESQNALINLGSQQAVKIDKNKLVLKLQPYGLQSFYASSDTEIVAVTEHVPDENVTYARERLAFAQKLMQQLETPEASAITENEKEAFANGLNQAWQAMAKQQTWRTVAELSRPHMLQIYNAMAQLPQGQIITRFPNQMYSEDKNQHYELLAPMIRAQSLLQMQVASSDATLINSDIYNEDWRGMQVLTSDSGQIKLELDIPADGPYAIHIGQVSQVPGTTVVNVNGVGLAKPAVTMQVNQPESAVLPPITLKRGKAILTLQRQGQFGIYGLKVLPVMQPMASPAWSTVGPFKSHWGTEVLAGRFKGDQGLKKTFSKVYPPQINSALDATYQNAYGQTIGWKQDNGIVRGRYHDWGVDITIRTGSPGADIAFGQCTITSDCKRTAMFYLPVDWWASAYLNGKRVRSTIDSKLSDIGYDFTTHYPTFYAVLELEKGENTLLVKQLGGSLGTRFIGYITKDDGLKISPVPTH
tara:strand:- start:121887 stop:126065 length:4179 start_codon:yes stop_codon:yes gene_type:complete